MACAKYGGVWTQWALQELPVFSQGQSDSLMGLSLYYQPKFTFAALTLRNYVHQKFISSSNLNKFLGV